MTTAGSHEARAAEELLTAARVPRDAVLFVHSAFRNLSSRGFRAEPFIEGLLRYMGSGTLAMPAMTWRIVTPESPVFDEIATPSHVGVLAELFRQNYATGRSIHPTHSVSAAGRLASTLLSGHHLDDTPCSPNSPYGQAVGRDAHILMLGIGLERVTAIHHAEEMIAPGVYLQPPERAEIYECRTRDGIAHSVRLRRHVRLNRDVPQFAAPLAAKGRLRSGMLAGTPWLAVTQQDLLEEVSAALRRNPRAIIAPPGAPIIP